MMTSRDAHNQGQTTEPYRTGLVLVLPRGLIRGTHRFFAPYHRAGVEAVCFWFGIQYGSLQVATTVVLPAVQQNPGHYSVIPASLRRAALDMRAQGLTNLAQVHTHPGSWVGHSHYDDDNAYSTKEGALSLVWPDYGESLNHDLRGIGVHEHQDGCWVPLGQLEVASRIRLIDSDADYRWNIDAGGSDDAD